MKYGLLIGCHQGLKKKGCKFYTQKNKLFLKNL